MSKFWNVLLSAYAGTIVLFTFWFVVIGSYKENIIPYISYCEEGRTCDLTNIGALTIGILITSFIALLIFKMQKEHAEGLAKVERSVTEKVYSKNIEEYECSFSFDEPENKNPDNAKKLVAEIQSDMLFK